MKSSLLIACFLLQLSNLAFGQTIRAVANISSKSIQTSSPTTYPGRQIMVGRGGGFSGFITTYYLLDNGKLFGQRNRDTTFTFISQQTATRTKRLFNTIEGTCKIKKTKFDHPGNRYTFVQWRKGKRRYKVVWGMPGHTVPATYPKFVDSFMALIPASARLK